MTEHVEVELIGGPADGERHVHESPGWEIHLLQLVDRPPTWVEAKEPDKEFKVRRVVYRFKDKKGHRGRARYAFAGYREW